MNAGINAGAGTGASGSSSPRSSSMTSSKPVRSANQPQLSAVPPAPEPAKPPSNQ
jgi:hypothetical protein